MTVVAANLKEMAADTLCIAGGSHTYTSKICRLDDGSIVGCAGTGSDAVVDWLKRGGGYRDAPPILEKDDWEVLHLRFSGLYLYTNSFYPMKLKEKNFAIGCGEDVAMYVMRKLKKSPVEACKEAIEMNHFCGGKVEVLKLEESK